MRIFFLLSIDGSAGRVDIHSLSDQSLIELLLTDLSNISKQYFQDDSGYFVDVCEWPNVECDTAGRVINIDSFPSQIEGTLHFAYIPPCAKILNTSRGSLGCSKFEGTLDTATLPQSLELLNISGNGFSGSVNFLSFTIEDDNFKHFEKRVFGQMLFRISSTKLGVPYHL